MESGSEMKGESADTLEEPISSEGGAAALVHSLPPLLPPSYVEELSEGDESVEGFSELESDPEMDDEDDELMKKAMLNPTIIRHLFGICPPSLLRKFRLVCKLWLDESLKPLRSSVKVSFSLDSFKSGRLERFLDFVEDTGNQFGSKPYTNFCLSGWDWREEECPNVELMNRFVELCSRNIVRLKLQDCNFEGAEEEFRRILFTCCPNLEFLHIITPYDGVEEGEEPIGPERGPPTPYAEHQSLTTLWLDNWECHLPIPWKEFLFHFPKLTSIRITDNVEALLTAMLDIRRRYPTKLRVEHLGWLRGFEYDHCTILASPDICDLLRQLRLPLQTLAVNIEKDTELDVINAILEGQAETLIKLIISDQGNIQFGVQLDTLKELELLRTAYETTPFAGLSLIQWTANLKKLVVGHKSFWSNFDPSTLKLVEGGLGPNSNVNLELLKELKVTDKIGPEDLRILVGWTPNVRILKMCLDDQLFPIVCGGWTKLERLTVFGNYLTDEGVTGRRADNSQNGAEEIRPNITHLKRLKKFELLCEMRNSLMREPPKLGDWSALHGFLKMDSLQSLVVSSTEMSEGVESKLMGKIPECEIVRWRRGNRFNFDRWEGPDYVEQQ